MDRLDRQLLNLAAGMSALAGFVDASGFLAANGYFVSFMSGNSTRMAAQLFTMPMASLAALGLIASFVAGVIAGALIADRNQPRPAPAVLWLVVAALAVASGLAAWELVIPCLGFLAVAMGALNNAFRIPGRGSSPGLTYMTGALTRLGQAIAGRITGQADPGAGAALALWLSLVVGGVSGALVYLVAPLAGLSIATLAALGLQRWAKAVARQRSLTQRT